MPWHHGPRFIVLIYHHGYRNSLQNALLYTASTLFLFFFLGSETIGHLTFFTTVVKLLLCQIVEFFFLKFKSPPIEYLLIKNIFVDSHSSLNFISTLYVFSAYHSQQITFRANEIWIIY